MVIRVFVLKTNQMNSLWPSIFNSLTLILGSPQGNNVYKKIVGVSTV